MTGEVTKRSSSANVMPRIPKGKNAQEVRENLVLRERQTHHVSSDGLYIPIFYTDRAKDVGESQLKKMYRDSLSRISAASLAPAAAVLGMVLMGTDVVGVAEGLMMMTAGSVVALNGVVAPALKGHNTKTLNKMMEASMASFFTWAQKRYGITVVEPSSLTVSAQVIITTGVKGNYPVGASFRDSITDVLYQVCITKDGTVYIGCPTPTSLTLGQAAPEAKVITTPALSSVSQQVIESRKRPLLPAEAATLHEQLLKAVRRLKSQKLTAEVAHQVDRTTETVETVLTKYYNLAELNATEQDNADLAQFFRNQIRFIDDLTVEHAQEVRKELNMELVAAEEIIRLNSLYLGGNR
jgi:hypothetical protein